MRNINRFAGAAATAAAAIAIGGPAIAGGIVSITPVALEGDNAKGVGNISRIDNLTVNDSGDWIVEADTDNPDTEADSVLLKNGLLLWREGDALAEPAGATLGSFDAVNLNVNGDSFWNIFLDGPPTGEDSGLYLNMDLIRQEGDETTAFQFSQGTIYRGFFEGKINHQGIGMALVTVDDPNIPTTVDQAIIRYDINGTSIFETVLLKEGDTIQGVTGTIVDFETNPHTFNWSGAVVCVVDMDSDTTSDTLVWHSGFGVRAQEGNTSPVGLPWKNFGTNTRVDVNLNDDWVLLGQADTGSSATDDLIVVNDVKLIQAGDAPPGVGGGFVITSFGTAPVLINNDGEALYYADWDDPNTDIDTGLFLDNTLLVQEGVTTVNGIVIDTIASVQDAFSMSPNGRFILFEATLADGRDGAFLIDRQGSAGAEAMLISFDFLLGTHLSGDLSDLEMIEGDTLDGQSQFGFSAQEANVLELAVGAANLGVANPTALDVSITSRVNNPGGTATLRMMNWTTGTPDVIGSWPIGQADVTQTFNGLDSDEYVQEAGATEILGRVRHAVIATFAASGFESAFDEMEYFVR